MVSGVSSAKAFNVPSATAYPLLWCSHLPGNTAMLYAQWYHQAMSLTIFCASSLCSLSLWERAGVRVPRAHEKPLTLTLSRGERGKAEVLRTGGEHEDDHSLAAALASTRHRRGARGVRLSHREAHRA